MTYRKKLIEVALPLEAINVESAREKSIRHGHPSTLHLWWARRPLAACRAVLWASLVDDPSSWPDKFPTQEQQNQERQRLFDILGRIEIEVDKKGNSKQVVKGLVSWEQINQTNAKILQEAQREIARSIAWNRNEDPPTQATEVRDYLAKYGPPVYDPFCGGGSIPLEAQRLGLQAHGSDLNPVAVLITKALIEIPPKFKNLPPLSQKNNGLNAWYGAQGLAQDVRFYGQWMRDEAFKRIGHLYPTVETPLAQDPTRGEDETPLPLTPSPTRGEGEQEQRWEVPVGMQKRMLEVSRQFRKEPTKSEEILWQAIRTKQLQGRKFRRQQAIGSFVVDFFCNQERLIVEVDGPIHDSQKEADQQRQALLESLGLRFVRISSTQVETDLLQSLKQITNAFQPSDPPSPLVGEGVRGRGVIAWLWARTVKCPNPACGAQMPLVRSFQLSTKKGKETWVEPIIDHSQTPPVINFEVKTGDGEALEGTVNRKGAICIACNSPTSLDHVRSEGKAGRMSAQLMAIVAEGQGGRVYLPPNKEHREIAREAQPTWKPDSDLPEQALGFRVQGYGMTRHCDLFTPRQLVALTTFSDLVGEARERVKDDAIAAGMIDDGLSLNDGGTGATAYADAVATYLAFGVDRISDVCSTICSWNINRDGLRNTFARQAIPMTWDFAEPNPFSDSAGNFTGAAEWIASVIKNSSCYIKGKVKQFDATGIDKSLTSTVISTDPPYYDNIGYADLSDYFYIWLRRSLSLLYPDIFSTLLVPKAPELVATPHRFGGDKAKAQIFFEEGLTKAFARMNEIADSDYPLTVYYAFKQSETEEDDNKASIAVASTGWETMLDGLIKAGFSIGGTWPMRTERSVRTIATDSNALASSIVLVCRPRGKDAPKVTRRQFLNELKSELPSALKLLQQGNIAPVDLAQASIGPGMAIFSKYTAVVEADGAHLKVRTALQLINQILDEFLSEQEGEFDSDTKWALTWFEQYQFEQGQFGEAETLSKAKNTSVQGMVGSGILEARSGKVRLLKRIELKLENNPKIPIWLISQHLIHVLDQQGEAKAAQILAELGSKADQTRELAYRLYSLCDRRGWTQESIAYNSLVISWPEISRLAALYKQNDKKQLNLL